MKRILPIALAISSASYASMLLAGDPVAEKLQKTLVARYPDIKIERVVPSVLPGLYEVVTPSEIVYADARADHLVLGQIVDTRTRENLTQRSWNEINKIDFNALPFDSAIKIVKGDGRRKLAIFEDPHCPFCQGLEQTLKTIDNITVHIFLYPLEGLHPGATESARRIWCAPDRASAWTTWMLDQKQPAQSDCADTPIAELAKLSERLRINSTPTLIFPDGTRIPGEVDADNLEKKLEASQKSSVNNN